MSFPKLPHTPLQSNFNLKCFWVSYVNRIICVMVALKSIVQVKIGRIELCLWFENKLKRSSAVNELFSQTPIQLLWTDLMCSLGYFHFACWLCASCHFCLISGHPHDSPVQLINVHWCYQASPPSHLPSAMIVCCFFL